MKLIEMPVAELLAAFQSSDPTPGGGSASALAAAMGASLLAMVAGLPKPRTTTDGEIGQLADVRARCTAHATELAGLVDADTDAYNLVVAAYRKPKGTEEEKAARSAAIQQALRAATDTPLQVMRASAAAIDQAGAVARLGNANAASDVRVALELLGAGLRGAKANVAINLEAVKDAEYAASVRREVEALEHQAGETAAAAGAALPA